MIADDEPFIRAGLFYRNDWKSMGFEVAALLEDGSDILKLLEKEHIDVLLTDICMFQVSGLEVAAVIHQKYPWVRVVLLSGYREFEYARQAMHSHVYEYLLKPIDYEKLREVFAQIKAELDENSHEEQLLKNLGEREYDQILNLTQNVAGSVMGNAEKTWLTYVKLKPVLKEAPDQIREIITKRLLDQLQGRLMEVAPDLAEKFQNSLKSVNFSEENGSQSLIEQLTVLNDELVSRNLISTDRGPIDTSISKACSYINNHLGEDFTYRDVAEFVHLSPRHFIRKFRSEMKETFTDYLIRMRIEGAERLMDEEKMDPADVACAVGYHDEKYFQKIFKEKAGCTVREYYQHVLGESTDD